MSRTLLAVLLLGVSFAAGAAAPRDPEEFFFDQTLGDLQEELETARAEGKRGILLFFEQEECPFCYRMKTTIFNQPEVQDFFRERFLILSMDIESDVEMTDFQGRPTTPKKFFRVVARNRGATPVLAFFDLDGNLVVRYTGATAGVEEFLWLGEYAAEGIYRQMSFPRYKRERRRQARASR